MQVVKLDNIRHSYGALNVLQGISFGVRAGEKVALIGPNGAGKTTAINVLNGLITPASGRIFFMGQDVTRIPAHKRASLGIARSFQITSLFFELSILQNVLVALHGIRRSSYQMIRPITAFPEMVDKARELLTSVDLWNQRDLYPKEISYGEQRRLEIILALASEPKVLLLDEPSAGLSAEESSGLGKMLRSSVHEEVAVLFVAHDLDLVFEVADRILVLYCGTILAEGNADQIQKNEKVMEVYFGTEATSA